MTPDDRIAELEGVVSQQHALIIQQREQITALLTEVQLLRGQLAKDSHNSHKPPTSDGLQRRPRSQRRKSVRTSGGQLGHPGQTLPLVATPDEVVTSHPTQCSHRQAAQGEVPAHAVERRQVLELPPVRLHIREHRMRTVRRDDAVYPRSRIRVLHPNNLTGVQQRTQSLIRIYPPSQLTE